MKLLELCQPLFQYVCLLNRSARKGLSYQMNPVRAEIDALLSEMAAKAELEPELAAQYQKIEPVLLFFVDSIIRQSHLAFAADWKEMAPERGETGGEEKFFDLLDDTLHDPTPDASERLEVFYTCIGLGFTGWYAGQPDHLRKRMLELSSRLRDAGATRSDDSDTSRIVPEAYEHVDTSNLVDPPGTSLVGIGIALVGLIAVLFGANLYLYRSHSHKLNETLDGIRQSADVPGARPAGSR